MKKTFLSLLVLASMSTFVSCKKEATPTAEATEIKVDSTAMPHRIDLENSVVNWKGTKPAGAHTGTIKFSDGEAMLINGNLQGGKFTFDMNSITVTDLKPGDGKEDLEGHLKGTGEKEAEDHFFNVKKHPKGSFEITKISEENGKKMITGNLTLKGISKGITFPATITNDEKGIVVASEPFTINRTEWNINYASKSVFDDLKDKFIDDNIELTVTLKVLK
ncbi:YceI family protein [Flavobacterium sp.]|uniref:YceI family protein n=1 Tax=Flavobacterium sp. TaxID=239 RepID=UPI0026387862|nr:YceI family protein [Flavobacterium sp.]MDD3004791.1 YceI family protein [Flavobacterium sp.]